MKQERHLTAEEKRLKNKRKQIEKIIRRGSFGSYEELASYIFRGNTYGSATRAYVICNKDEIEKYIWTSNHRKENELRSNYNRLIH